MRCRPRTYFVLIVLAILCSVAGTAGQTPADRGSPKAYQAGVAAMQRGDLPAARTAFEKAVGLNPRSADAQNMLGQVLLQQGDLDDAMIHFQIGRAHV